MSSKARDTYTCFWLATFPDHERRQKGNPQVCLSFCSSYSSAILPWWAPGACFLLLSPPVCFVIAKHIMPSPSLHGCPSARVVATAFNYIDSGSSVFLDCLATFPVGFVVGATLFFMYGQTARKVWWGLSEGCYPPHPSTTLCVINSTYFRWSWESHVACGTWRTPWGNRTPIQKQALCH